MSDGASEMGKMKAAHQEGKCWLHCYFCKQEKKNKLPKPVRGWWQREDK